MRSVRVPILDDSLAERVERFSVTLLPTIESVTLSPGRGQATVEIIDNDCKEQTHSHTKNHIHLTLVAQRVRASV